MSTLQHFHRFADLPRELQLHIWEFYERTQPHRRHYFRNMMVSPGRLYAGADQYTSLRISTIANAADPDETEVPDAAVAPNTKIQLPSNGNLDQNWVSRNAIHTAASFIALQGPAAMASPAYIWANFKNDSFCFARNRGSQKFLQYLEGATGLLPLTSSSQPPVISHWFHRVQRLVLISRDANQTLGPFDRQILRAHRSLRSLTIVTTLNHFICDHLHFERLLDTSRKIERVPLTTFLEMRQTLTGTCPCGWLWERLDEFEQLRRDLVDLFQTRTNSAPPVNVGIEVEVCRPGVESLANDTQSL